MEAELERFDKLGEYFVYHKILERFGISFDKFLKKVDEGTWEEFILLCQTPLPVGISRG